MVVPLPLVVRRRTRLPSLVDVELGVGRAGIPTDEGIEQVEASVAVVPL